MAGTVRTYSAKQVLIALGSHSVTGYAEDSFVTIAKNGDGVVKKTGCDGEIARAIDPDNTYSVKLSVLQTSPTNVFLQRMFQMDYDTGEGMFPIMVKDLKGKTVFSADMAWAAKPADRSYGKDTVNREWTIETGDATVVEG